MIQTIKMEHCFDSDVGNIKNGVRDGRQLGSYLTNILDENILILTFYGCIEA